MSIINVNGIDYTIKYVDSGASGDGSTPANALSNVPLNGSITSNVVYLIRRSSICHITSNSSSAAENVFFIGMPLSTDDLYARVPQEAKTAWDGDVETHATIRFDSRAYIYTLTQCKNFGAFRIKFDRVTVNSDDSYSGSNLYVTGAISPSRYGTCFLSYCFFVDVGNDFSDIGYNNALMYSNPKFSLYGFETVIINNNKIVHASWRYSMFGFQNDDRIYIENNEIWLASGTISEGDYVFNLSGSGTSTIPLDEVYVRNNTIKYYGQNNSVQYYKGFLYIDYAYNFIIENNSFLFDRKAATPTSGGFGPIIYIKRTLTSSTGNLYRVVKDIKIDLRNAGVSYYNFSGQTFMLYFDLYHNPILSHAVRQFDNIDVKLDPVSSAVGASYGILWFRGGGSDRLTNISIDCNIALKSTNNTVEIDKCGYFQSSYIRGKCVFKQCGLVDIGTLDFSDYDILNALTNANSIIKVDSLLLNSSNVSNTMVLTTYGSTSYYNDTRTIIESCNRIPYYNFLSITSASPNCGLWLLNNNGSSGNLKSTNYYYKAETWGVGRSTSYSLKCNGLISDSRYPLSIAPNMFKSIQLIPNASSGTIKMYVAYKNYLDMTLFNKRVKYFVDSNVTGIVSGKTKKTTSSLVEGNTYDDPDSNLWSESGLTAKVVEIPFYTDYPTDPLDIRILFDWYDPNGYTYIDIEPVLG